MGMTSDLAAREAFIAGLRDLADFVAANPAVAVPGHGAEIMLIPPGSDEDGARAITAFAEAVGAQLQDDRAASGALRASRAFGPVLYIALTYTAAALAKSSARYSYADCIQVDPPAAVPGMTAGAA